MGRRRLLATLPVALVASLAVDATAARASSIVFIKRGDVWLSKPDGTGQRAITKDGNPRNPYRSPAYSNKGVITAVKAGGTSTSSTAAASGCARSATCPAAPRLRTTR